MCVYFSDQSVFKYYDISLFQSPSRKFHISRLIGKKLLVYYLHVSLYKNNYHFLGL